MIKYQERYGSSVSLLYISFFTPEPTRGCCALFHIQYSSKCFSAPTYKHYLLLLKSVEFHAFSRVLAKYVNFVPVNMSKLLNGHCYVEIELRSGILEVKNLQKELLFRIL